MSRQHKILHFRKLHKQLSNSCYRNGKWHVWQLNGILLARDGYLFLNWYSRLGKEKFWLFNGWISKIVTKKNISLRYHPRHNNDRSLTIGMCRILCQIPGSSPWIIRWCLDKTSLTFCHKIVHWLFSTVSKGSSDNIQQRAVLLNITKNVTVISF
jgi:hypothetical protein